MDRPKLLCVGSDLCAGGIYQQVLRSHDYEVIIANRSSRALALLNTNPTIEVVLLDHELLGMKASELVSQIKLRRPHLSIILVSACDSVVQDAVKFVEGAVIKGSDAFANVLNQLQLLTAARL